MALIIDMKMPKCCADCSMCEKEPVSAYGDGYYCWSLEEDVPNGGTERHKNCPIRGEITNKHGALKDANTLKELTKNTEIRNSRGEIYLIGKVIAKMIDEAPTVVESEE